MQEGFSTETGGNYVKVTRGKFLQKDEAGDFELINDEGKKTMYRSSNVFRGSLIGIDQKDSQFGKQWVFKLRAAGKVYLFSFIRGSLTAQGFLNALANLEDYNGLELKSWSKDGLKTTGTSIYVEKNGTQIKWKYDHKTEMPPVLDMKDENGEVIFEKNGKPRKNDKERCLFFDGVIAVINKRIGYVQGETVNEETGEVSGGFSEEEEASTFASSSADAKPSKDAIEAATTEVAF